MKPAKRCLIFAAILAVSLASAAPAFAAGHLDPSFGTDGIASVSILGEDDYLGLTEMQTGPKGEIFFIEGDRCSQSNCPYRLYLRRYNPTGHLDAAFGRPLVGEVTGEAASLAVDSSGRALAAIGEESQIAVTRYGKGGQPDPSFGEGGTVTLECGCELDSVVAAPGGGVLVLGHAKPAKGGRHRGTIRVITRLRGDGSLDRSFAKAGVLRRPPLRSSEFSASLEPNGKILLQALAGELPGGLLIEGLSPRGKLLPRFARNATKALHGLKGTRPEDIGWNGFTLLPRRHGGVTVVGFPYEEHGSVAALLANGKADPSFANGGRRKLPFETTGAAPDGHGGGLLAGYLYRGHQTGYKVAHLLPDGAFDKSFGFVGLPGASNEEGVFIQPAGPGAAIVYDPGLPFCRSACRPPKPKLYRVELGS